MTKITADYWLELSRDLEQHHSLFYQCWGMGRPTLNANIPTACVVFDEFGEHIDFVFNPDFWESLSHYGRLFVISHECLHVILNHGLRTTSKNKDNPRVNIALDLVVNEMLCRCFGFNREEINIKDLCWIDSVFPPDCANIIPQDESYEFYYKLLPPTPTVSVNILDDHSLLGGKWDKVIDKLNNNLSEEERAAIRSIIGKHSSISELNQWAYVKSEIHKKRKFESVIKKWSQKFLREEIQNEEQWARIARRLNLLPENIILPSEMEVDWIEKDRIPVFLFLDTSGSCYDYRERFWSAGASLPNDRFDVRMFYFDDIVVETSLKDKKIRLGYGTSFSIIESHIQKVIKTEGVGYPEAVFVITDGYGDPLNPQKPQNWFWFLTDRGTRKYIPSQSKTFSLKDYE